MKYEKGQAVRFIRNSRTHLVPCKGAILDSDTQWEAGEYAFKVKGRPWHFVKHCSGVRGGCDGGGVAGAVVPW